jgi:acyl-coenzyme A thioesterase 13
MAKSPVTFGKEEVEEKMKEWFKAANGDQDTTPAGNWMADIVPHISYATTPSEEQRPSLLFNYTVQPGHCNRMQNLHGGCMASIFDFTTTLSLLMVSRPGFWQTMGVSQNLNITYLRPAPIGTELLIEVEIVQVGKTLAILRGTMRRKSGGQITATCEHSKVNVDARAKI